MMMMMNGECRCFLLSKLPCFSFILGAQEHRCSICLRAFTRNSSLQAHLKKQVCQQLGRREGLPSVGGVVPNSVFQPSTMAAFSSNHQLLSPHMQQPTQNGQNQQQQCHQCTFCSRTFTKKSSLNTHLQMKRCTGFSTSSDLGVGSVVGNQNSVLPASLINYSLDHYQSQLKHQNEQYAKLFPNKNQQNGHQTTQSVYLKQYQCSVCSKSFSEMNSLNVHYQCTHNRCQFCNTFYKNLKDLVKHMENVHQVRNLTAGSANLPEVYQRNGNKKAAKEDEDIAKKQYQCGVCEKRFHRKSCLTEHLLTHSGVRPYSCSLCSMSFTKNYNLQVHMGTHSTARPYKCMICEADFKRNDYLKAHMKTTHNITLGQPLLRSLQDQTVALQPAPPVVQAPPVQPLPNNTNHTSNHFGNVYQFLSSSAAAATNAAASLPIPLQFFVQSQTPLTSSLQLSSSSLPQQPQQQTLQPSSSSLPAGNIAKPYRCTACSKDFKLKSSLQRHSLLHSGPKKHQCSHCQRAFTTKSHLIEHNLRMHSAFRQHHCTHCRMAFRKRGELTDHLRTHSSERPFRCSLCEKAFKHQKNQKYHLRKVHQFASL